MTHSADLTHLVSALALVQSKLKPVQRNAEGESGRYADLAAIRQHTRKLLTSHDIVVVQSGGYDTIETTLLHISGEWITLSAKCETSASGEVRYGARHALMMALGVVEAPEMTVSRALSLLGMTPTAADIIEHNKQKPVNVIFPQLCGVCNTWHTADVGCLIIPSMPR